MLFYFWEVCVFTFFCFDCFVSEAAGGYVWRGEGGRGERQRKLAPEFNGFKAGTVRPAITDKHAPTSV